MYEKSAELRDMERELEKVLEKIELKEKQHSR